MCCAGDCPAARCAIPAPTACSGDSLAQSVTLADSPPSHLLLSEPQQRHRVAHSAAGCSAGTSFKCATLPPSPLQVLTSVFLVQVIVQQTAAPSPPPPAQVDFRQRPTPPHSSLQTGPHCICCYQHLTIPTRKLAPQFASSAQLAMGCVTPCLLAVPVLARSGMLCGAGHRTADCFSLASPAPC